MLFVVANERHNDLDGRPLCGGGAEEVLGPFMLWGAADASLRARAKKQFGRLMQLGLAMLACM